MKHEIFCSQSSTHVKTRGIKEQADFKTVLRATGRLKPHKETSETDLAG
jgi:hypothetical protein